MSFSSFSSVIQEVKKMSNWSSNAKSLASKHGLDIVNVTWEDNARYSNSAWGPCISDMTLQVNNERMPVIRQPNFTDKTWDVSIEKIPVVVGNEKKNQFLRTITLKEYLQDFHKYMTNPPWNKSLNLLVTDKSAKQKDTHVIMSSQACFLPVEKSQETKFNVALYNYQSRSRDPAVLVIASTSKGTSAQIIEGTTQPLFFNNGGSKGEFVAQRLTDNRKERGVALEGEMTKQEKQDNVIVIIQVPLKQKPIPSQPMFGGYKESSFDNFNSFSFTSNNYSNTNWCNSSLEGIPSASLNQQSSGGWGWHSQPKLQASSKPDVEAAIVKVVSSTPICNDRCKKELKWISVGSNECYNGKDLIQCDKCTNNLYPGTMVWHCPVEHHQTLHKHGYDLCQSCGQEQLKWDELNGLSTIERDTRYPIRVTLQYYQSTSNGVMNSDIMAQIANMLTTSKKQADFVGSLPTDSKDSKKLRPTEWMEIKNDDKYKIIKQLLRDTFGDEDKNLISIFERENFDDTVLESVDSKEDLSDVLNKSGDRIKFFKAIQKWKQEKTSTNFLDGLI